MMLKSWSHAEKDEAEKERSAWVDANIPFICHFHPCDGIVLHERDELCGWCKDRTANRPMHSLSDTKEE